MNYLNIIQLGVKIYFSTYLDNKMRVWLIWQ
ncbi:Uncharacterised protein [Shewanella baltica]|nr:Uncharacterised protein [Shewanella baltica]